MIAASGSLALHFRLSFSFMPATAYDVLLDQPLNSDNIQKITKNVKQILDT